MRTWARALLGPLLAGDPAATRKAEMQLLGSAAGSGDAIPTYRVAITRRELGLAEHFEVLPHRGGPKLAAWAPRSMAAQGQDDLDDLGTLTMRFTLRPQARRADPGHLQAALASVAWAAFAFGSLGLRSRRGFGSMTIERLHGLPAELPAWPRQPAAATLFADLAAGLRAAQQHLATWLESKGHTVTMSGAGLHTFFQLADATQVWGQHQSSPRLSPSLERLMSQCSGLMKERPVDYQTTLGSSPPEKGKRDKKRLASPLWFRVYDTRDSRGKLGFVLVATYSPRTNSELARTLLEKLEMSPIGELARSPAGA